MAQTNGLGTELEEKTGNNIIDRVITNREVPNDPEPVSLSKRVRGFFAFFTVEPFLLCYFVPSVISGITLQQLGIHKACRSDLGYSESVCATVTSGDFEEDENSTSIFSEASLKSQIVYADMVAWKQPLQSGIPAIVILFVGAWSDKTGNRRALMMIPVIGELISSLGLMLSTYFFEWPLFVNGLIEALPTAFTGGISIALMGSYSYLADVTTVETRTFRIGLVGLIVTLGLPIGSAMAGVLTQSVGYYGIFGIAVALNSVAIIYTYLRIKDVRKTPEERHGCDKFIEFFNPKNAWETLSLIILSRGRLLLKIVLIVIAHIVIQGPVAGEGGVMYSYFLQRYHMDLVEFGFFSSYMLLVGISGTAIVITLFSKWLKFHDAVIGMIATISKVSGSLMYALAPTKKWIYAAPVIDIFGNTSAIAIRSLGTKVVPPEKVGKMCSLIGFVEALLPVIYAPLYSKVYSNTVETFSGAFYLLGGAMTIPALIIYIFLYISLKKEERDTVKNPDEKEMHAHENAVTVL